MEDAMIDPLAATVEFASTLDANAGPRMVFELSPEPGADAVGLLRLRAGYPTVCVVDARDAGKAPLAARLAAGFEDGIQAYVVGGGDLASDLELVDRLASGAPPFEIRD
jgi:hypothetical protein